MSMCEGKLKETVDDRLSASKNLSDNEKETPSPALCGELLDRVTAGCWENVCQHILGDTV